MALYLESSPSNYDKYSGIYGSIPHLEDGEDSFSHLFEYVIYATKDLHIEQNQPLFIEQINI